MIVDGKVVANAMEMDDAAVLAQSDALAAMEAKPYRGGRWIVDGGQDAGVDPGGSRIRRGPLHRGHDGRTPGVHGGAPTA